MDRKWTKNGPKTDQKRTKNGPKTDQKRTKNGQKTDQKLIKNWTFFATIHTDSEKTRFSAKIFFNLFVNLEVFMQERSINDPCSLSNIHEASEKAFENLLVTFPQTKMGIIHKN